MCQKSKPMEIIEMPFVSTDGCLRNQMFCLKFFGLWDWHSNSVFYRIYSIALRWVFLYMGSLLQLMYILSVDNFEVRQVKFWTDSHPFHRVSLHRICRRISLCRPSSVRWRWKRSCSHWMWRAFRVSWSASQRHRFSHETKKRSSTFDARCAYLHWKIVAIQSVHPFQIACERHQFFESIEFVLFVHCSIGCIAGDCSARSGVETSLTVSILVNRSLLIFHRMPNNYLLLSKSTLRYPFDIDAFVSNFFNFSVLYVFHSISGWTAAGLDISIDALIYGLLTIVKYQLKMLGHRLQNANAQFNESILIHREIL